MVNLAVRLSWTSHGSLNLGCIIVIQDASMAQWLEQYKSTYYGFESGLYLYLWDVSPRIWVNQSTSS